MNPEDEVMKEYLEAVLKTLRNRIFAYWEDGKDSKERFIRTTNIKDALKGVGSIETFGVMSGSYSSCPEGLCVGGVCIGDIGISDAVLTALGRKLDVSSVL